MPVHVRIDPFSQQPVVRSDLTLRTPQARVLHALMPEFPDDPVIMWPLLNRVQLSLRAGYTAISGTVTRALNGIKAGSSSGDPYPGLLVRGLIEEVVLTIEGVSEVNYRATANGVRAYKKHVAEHGTLPALKDTASCTNLYQGKGAEHRSKRRAT